MKGKLFLFSMLMLTLIIGMKLEAISIGISTDGRYFTINGNPTFLNGVSYFAGLSIADTNKLSQDLQTLYNRGYNWIRVFVSWGGRWDVIDGSTIDEFCSVINNDPSNWENGDPHWVQTYKDRLHTLIQMCDAKGIIVDLTLGGADPANDFYRLYYPCSHVNRLKWLNMICQEFKQYDNMYIDVCNEGTNTLDEVRQYIEICKTNGILCTFSGISPNYPERFLALLTDTNPNRNLDFLSFHIAGNNENETINKFNDIRNIVDTLNNNGKRVPVHCQENVRANYTNWDTWHPDKGTFYRDYLNSRLAGAAGWCFHNGARNRSVPNISIGMPLHFSFLMTQRACGTLSEQLDYSGNPALYEERVRVINKDVFYGLCPELFITNADFADIKKFLFKRGYTYQSGWQNWDEEINNNFSNSILVSANSPSKVHKVTYKLSMSNLPDNGPVVQLVVHSSSGEDIYGEIINRNEVQPGDNVLDLLFPCLQASYLSFGARPIYTAGIDLKEVRVALDGADPQQNSLAVVLPNGGEVWAVGEKRFIIWTSTGVIEKVKIELSRNNGTNWEPIISETNNTGLYEWTVTSPASTNCLVRINDVDNPATNDTSNAVFEIAPEPPKQITVTSPNGGEVWQAGTAHNISWTTNGNITRVNIEYSYDNGASWGLIVSSTENDGIHPWIVPNTPSTVCIVRITDSNGTTTDISNITFTITAPTVFEVYSPKSADWIEPYDGFPYPIRWRYSTDLQGKRVHIWLLNSQGQWERTIAMYVPIENQRFDWWLPRWDTALCGRYFIIQVDIVNGNRTAYSEWFFVHWPSS